MAKHSAPARGADQPKVSVCVCTFRRPELLAALFDGLRAQEGLSFAFEIVVVDNDAAGSAAPTIAAARARHAGLVIRDFVEPRQNIARARNRAVHEARGAFIAMIDDDELPSSRWLHHLHNVADALAADGVVGPVVPRLPSGVAPWIIESRFFERRRGLTGAPVPRRELRTSNLLVRRDLLVARRLGDGGDRRNVDAGDNENVGDGPFDPDFGLSGGEDTELLEALSDGGARFVYSDEAVISEAIPAARARMSYLWKRAFGGGNSHARLQLRNLGSRSVPTLLIRGGGAVGLGVIMSAASLPFGLHKVARWSCIGAAGAGKLLALTRFRYEGYRAPKSPTVTAATAATAAR